MYDFEAQGDDELTVSENEHLIILEKENDDWWKVRNDAGQEGVVPASYVEASEAGAAGAASSRMLRPLLLQHKKKRTSDSPGRRGSCCGGRSRTSTRSCRTRTASRGPQEEGNKRTSCEERHSRLNPPLLLPSSLNDQAQPRSAVLPRTSRSHKVAVHPSDPKTAVVDPSLRPTTRACGPDRTGQFKVEAEFLGFNQGKIRLHKMNGVVIEVAVEKMSDPDIKFLEDITGKTLNPTDDEIAASNSRRRERERERQSSRSQASSGATSSMSREDREKERERRKEKEREQRRRDQAKSGPKRNVDWFEFFLAAGVDVDDCTRYASAFERDKIDETVLGDLDPGTLRSLGLREGDIIRVTKFIDRKYRRDKSHTSSSSRQSGRPTQTRPQTSRDRSRRMKIWHASCRSKGAQHVVAIQSAGTSALLWSRWYVEEQHTPRQAYTKVNEQQQRRCSVVGSGFRVTPQQHHVAFGSCQHSEPCFA